MANQHLSVSGMTCVNCEKRIEKALGKHPGITSVKADFSRGTVTVSYDSGQCGEPDIASVITQLGYRVGQPRRGAVTGFLGAALILFALWQIAGHLGLLDLFSRFPVAGEHTSLLMLFVIGVLTSFHCVAMCGGIGLSQSVGQPSANGVSPLAAGLLYNLGRVVSYTIVGAAIGAVGAVVSISPTGRGIITSLAGIFMLVMGLGFLGVFPSLNRLVPHMPEPLARLARRGEGKGPLVVGLLNGFMPCGPLQAMQLYALGTGSAVGGALSMLLFSLGTVPLMLGLCIAGSLLSKQSGRRMMSAGAALVILMGVGMLQNGLGLVGIGAPGSTGASPEVAEAEANQDVQVVRTELSPRGYPAITVEAGTPVDWIVTAGPGSLTGCNYSMVLPQYQMQVVLDYGDNLIQFTPDEPGTFLYSCWMGMIRGTITVTEPA